MTDEPQKTLMGWCVSHGKPDQFHNLCRGEYTTPFGVRRVCSCPNHEPKKED